jgi:ABC-type spermidine/putrescine transport system permease subunit I
MSAEGFQQKGWRLSGWGIYLLIPVLVLFSVFFVLPMIRIFGTSFFDPSFTFRHYLPIFQESVYIKVLLRTLTMALFVSAVCLVLGYPVAYLLSDLRPRIANVLLVLVLIPLWTSILVRSYAWMVLLGREGILNKMLLYFHLISTPLKLLYTSTAVILGMVQVLLPFMILPLLSVMKGIDRNLMKAAHSLGAGPFHTFFRVYLPLSLPGVAAGFLLVFIIALGFFITPALLGGRKDILISMLIEEQVRELLNWEFAAALSLVLFLVTIAIILVFNRFIGLDKLFSGWKL